MHMATKSFSSQLYKNIVLSFIGLTGVLVVFVLYVSFTEAKIHIVSAKKPVSADFLIDVQKGDAGEGAIRGEMFAKEVKGEQIFSATGAKSGVSRSKGTITIYNNYSKDQPLVATTRFLTADGLLFRLKEGVRVPAGGKVTAELSADEEGVKYDIGPSKFTIPGLWEGLRDKIYAESSSPMTGGASTIKAVTSGDIANAKNTLSDRLLEEGKTELKKEFLGGMSLDDNLVFREIIESATDAVEGEETETFSLSMTLRVIALAVSRDELMTLAETKLRSTLDEDRRLKEVLSESLRYTLEKYDLKEGRANVRAHLEGMASLRDTSLLLNKDRLAGLSADEAKAYLTIFPEIEDVRVELSPFWKKKIPRLKDHIKIIVE